MRIALALVAGIFLSPAPIPTATSACGMYDYGSCYTTEWSDSGVIVSESLTAPGRADTPAARRPDDTPPLAVEAASPPPAEPPCIEEGLTRCPYVVNVPGPDPTPESSAAAPGAGTAAITITDLASFSPAVGDLIVQPDGWGVRGVPTNFSATATEHVRSGTLLGRPIQVRWRPVAFTFDYGDGATVTVDAPGVLWEGADEHWTPTRTSHEYPERGTYRASLTVTFEADIDTGGGWGTVPGTLQRTAPTEEVRIVTVQTVLTRGDCLAHPGDPGCAR